MYKDKSILAIIPARGGSKGLPRKNIKLLLGKPLIAWTIEQALNSKYIDRLIVSTEDEEIAEISQKYGAEIPFLRPKELAQDDTPTIDVIDHVIMKLNQQYDITLLLEPTSPIRRKNDLDKAVEKFIDNYDIFDSLVTLGEIHLENPIIVKRIKNDFVRPFIENDVKITRRQDYPKAYFPYGVAYLAKTDFLLKNKTFYGDKTGYLIIERYQCYEIDDIYDFIAVESIMKYLLERGVL
ncbi:acylneuraminate cytidylyltransferase family protein [hot springs metagenome]|uniref:Acylneuraminate cytidylyltransferase family protein n=1 Tax=hot springs metagenome TaxID=433727 RepID=A0A5J4L792_9ZZZZ